MSYPRACCVGLLDFSGPTAQHLRILGPAAWVSWISPVLLRSICVKFHTKYNVRKMINAFTGYIRSHMSQHVSENGESHRRCRNARNGNHHLLYGQVQVSLARRSKAHTIIKPHGDGSQDALQHTYVLVASFQKARTRWRIKATRINVTRGGRMLDLRDQEKMQMIKQR